MLIMSKQEQLPLEKNLLSGAMVLGYSQEQRGSELQAGSRAELQPSPITLALSSTKGRLIAKIMLGMRPPQAFLNYVSIRIPALVYAMKQALPSDERSSLLVDLHAGYSSMGVLLAQDLPQHTMLEIDVPEVIHDKQQRLRQISAFSLPSNLKFKSANFTQISLSQILDNQLMDAVLLNGSYVRPNQFIKALEYVREHTNKGGAVVCTFPWLAGIEEVQNIGRVFRSQVGNTPGIVHNVDDVQALFTQGGFPDVQVLHLSEIAQQINHDLPMNVEIIVLAR